MPRKPDPIKPRESSLLLALFALFLFASPLTIWWASDHSPWLLPFGLWLLIILIGAWLHWKFTHNGL